CGDDFELKKEVESLLRSHEGTRNFLGSSILDATTDSVGSRTSDLLTGKLLGPYELKELVGSGGMGDVYRAKDTRLHRTVAIKVLPRDRVTHPDLKRRFLHEARAASGLNHPNIVVVYDISNADGIDFLVLEFVLGKTLREMIPAGGLPLSDVSDYGTQIASGLAAAHAAGIVHRDIKPGNIMITPESRVKILDFGIAKLIEPAGMASEDVHTWTEQTTAGVVVGTVAYMSPEQVRGETPDSRSD